VPQISTSGPLELWQRACHLQALCVVVQDNSSWQYERENVLGIGRQVACGGVVGWEANVQDSEPQTQLPVTASLVAWATQSAPSALVKGIVLSALKWPP